MLISWLTLPMKFKLKTQKNLQEILFALVKYRKPAFREASQRFWPREIWVRTQSASFKSVNMLNKHGGWVRSHECYLKSVLKTI